jgi:hypothetical protein
MQLFHAFPRPARRSGANADGSAIIGIERQKGLEILRMILTHGLLCTPEKFELYPNHHTENARKLEFLKAHQPHDKITASRGCFTLVDAADLSKEYRISTSGDDRFAAHADLFGEFAIGIDPIEARTIGVLPAVYYYRHDLISQASKVAGLGSQIVERLDEIRNVFAVLSYIEGRAHQSFADDESFPPPEVLAHLGIRVRHQDEIEAELETLGEKSAEYIFKLFNTDRVPAWNLFDFIEIMLSLYQTTDSTLEDAPLAFFQQREWRLIHHNTMGLKWVGLGEHTQRRNPLAPLFRNDIEKLRSYIRQNLAWMDESKLKTFFDHCWVLSGTEDRHFRDFVREIVIPEDFCKEAEAIVASLPFVGDRPVIRPLRPRWRIVHDSGYPEIIHSRIH